MKKIAIVGHGYVGKAIERFFKDHFEVLFYDPNDKDSSSKEDCNTADLAIVCVPTPMKEDGSVDLSIIEETINWLDTPLILIKSTIPPGTTNKLKSNYKQIKGLDYASIAFSPEYVGEGKYVVQWWKDKGYAHPTDMKYHDFQIFGGDRETTKAIIPFFQRVTGPEVKYMQTDSTTAEVVKYMENSWGFMKVMFCNEFYDISQAFGVDYNEVRELWLLDGRVERMHTAVFVDDRKVGGKCFPKDLNGIVKASEKAGHDPKLLKAVLQKNLDIRQ